MLCKKKNQAGDKLWYHTKYRMYAQRKEYENDSFCKTVSVALEILKLSHATCA